MTIADILKAAADLIEKPGAWTQTEGARTLEGWGTTANDPRAVAWDIIGAIHKVSRDDELTERAKNAVLARVGNLATYNDALGRAQSDVVTTLRVVAKATATEQGERG